MSVRIGNIDFESASYYAEGDVLYLHNGSPSDAVDFDGSPEGHHTRYDAAGNLIGIMIVNARLILDLEGAITVTLPDRVLAARDLGDVLTAA
jgi:uncharacterized protein YuzE